MISDWASACRWRKCPFLVLQEGQVEISVKYTKFNVLFTISD